MRKDFEFGKTIYSFSERDRIQLVLFLLNDHILRMSMEKEEQHFTLIENILKMISDTHAGQTTVWSIGIYSLSKVISTS